MQPMTSLTHQAADSPPFLYSAFLPDVAPARIPALQRRLAYWAYRIFFPTAFPLAIEVEFCFAVCYNTHGFCHRVIAMLVCQDSTARNGPSFRLFCHYIEQFFDSQAEQFSDRLCAQKHLYLTIYFHIFLSISVNVW